MVNSVFDDRGVQILGNHLEGLNVDVIVTGGIAAMESPRFVRELRRYGARTRVVMTEAAQKFITPLSLEWASQSEVISELSGAAEHISQADASVVFPCTLDFLSRVSLGLADSAATCFLQSQLGRKPIIFVPAMHESLEQNPIYQERKKSLLKIKGVHLVEPVRAEGKAKVPSIESVAARVCHIAGRRTSLRGLGAVISLGPTRSQIDEMRFISNRSTGALGLAIANELFRRGATLQVVAGPCEVSLPDYLPVVRIESNDEMLKAFQAAVKKVNAQIGIFSAAVLDFEVKKSQLGKLKSDKPLTFDLVPSAKLITKFKNSKMLKVGFKLEAGLTQQKLVAIARQAMIDQDVEVLIANRLEDVGREKHAAFVLSQGSTEPIKVSTKQEIAKVLADVLESRLQNLKLNSKEYPAFESSVV